MLFTIGILVIWMIFILSLRKRKGRRFELSEGLLPLVLVSYLVTIDLGINYVAGAISKLNDGIGLHSKFAFFIIGEDGWSIELFQKIYNISFTISILLTIIYTGLKLVKSNKGE